MPWTIERDAPRARISDIVENVVGCKWTLHVLAQVRNGVTRPGRLVHTAEGLTTKMLNERLAKLVRYGVLEKVSYPETPPRVEYHLTPLGQRLNAVLDAIESLQADLDADRVTPQGRTCRRSSGSSPYHVPLTRTTSRVHTGAQRALGRLLSAAREFLPPTGFDTHLEPSSGLT